MYNLRRWRQRIRASQASGESEPRPARPLGSADGRVGSVAGRSSGPDRCPPLPRAGCSASPARRPGKRCSIRRRWSPRWCWSGKNPGAARRPLPSTMAPGKRSRPWGPAPRRLSLPGYIGAWGSSGALVSLLSQQALAQREQRPGFMLAWWFPYDVRPDPCCQQATSASRSPEPAAVQASGTGRHQGPEHLFSSTHYFLKLNSIQAPHCWTN